MKKTRVAWTIIIAVAGLIISVISLSVTVAQNRYNVRGVDSSYQWKSSFQKNQSLCAIGTTKHWTKGSVYYGVNQKYGTTKTKYSIYSKKANKEYKLMYGEGYTSRNNTYYGEYYGHYAGGKDKYSYKLEKRNNKNVKSQLVVDLFVI
ncbi:hypothetical protein C1903_09090 [Listeria ivanovii]|uniref:hypothetical protein n=1 Tax=Listeria ivanovii TaxID=1638 RepID=UPI000DA97E60|nr:hypothetical protein [Listeria ivanovii]PZF88616.1 hypothetical protein C1905_09245 [Listeria ivanovii]PZF93777.1 hypothetical protein C1903_09090 [Listeria ivanovii]PZG04608.1 hypothetical protein C2L88_08725 [Listeria ivanovii]PZG08991.1 hypothetical protein C1901_09080 [Listeria ivanovii]PZG25941.1 hypothetical protein C1900_09255 [Listeria ivanovii]